MQYPPKRPKATLGSFKVLFTPKYRQRTILAGTVGACQSMQYYAVGFFLPFIVGAFLSGDRLNSITVPLVFNFLFGVTGGFAGVLLARRLGSWTLSLSGFIFCLVALIALGAIGEPSSTAMVLLAGFLIGAFVFFHSYGPGAQGMTMATLSYPTTLRGTGAGFGQAALRVGSTISLLLFPILAENFGTRVFWIVAIAPAIGIVALLIIRWDPMAVDVDAEDFDVRREPGTGPTE